jgi:hypothetical protein
MKMLRAVRGVPSPIVSQFGGTALDRLNMQREVDRQDEDGFMARRFRTRDGKVVRSVILGNMRRLEIEDQGNALAQCLASYPEHDAPALVTSAFTGTTPGGETYLQYIRLFVGEGQQLVTYAVSTNWIARYPDGDPVGPFNGASKPLDQRYIANLGEVWDYVSDREVLFDAGSSDLVVRGDVVFARLVSPTTGELYSSIDRRFYMVVFGTGTVCSGRTQSNIYGLIYVTESEREALGIEYPLGPNDLMQQSISGYTNGTPPGVSDAFVLYGSTSNNQPAWYTEDRSGEGLKAGDTFGWMLPLPYDADFFEDTIGYRETLIHHIGLISQDFAGEPIPIPVPEEYLATNFYTGGDDFTFEVWSSDGGRYRKLFFWSLGLIAQNDGSTAFVLMSHTINAMTGGIPELYDSGTTRSYGWGGADSEVTAIGSLQYWQTIFED